MKNYNIIIDRQLVEENTHSSIERYIDKAIEMYLTGFFNNKFSNYYGGGYEGLGRKITLGFELPEKPDALRIEGALKLLLTDSDKIFKLTVEIEEYKEED